MNLGYRQSLIHKDCDNTQLKRNFFRLIFSFVLLFSMLATQELNAAQGLNATGSPVTSPNVSTIKLLGTIVGNNQQSIALIQLENKKIHAYSLHDKIGDYTLTNITRNKINLLYKAVSYTVHLQQKISSLANSEILTDQSQSELPQEIHIKRTLLTHIGNNIQQWLNAVSLEPVIKDGYLRGYRVDSIVNTPLKASIGLLKDDILKSINGVHVGQATLFSKIVNNLNERTNINIQIERGHKTHILNYHVSE